MPITKTTTRKGGLQQYRVRINYTDNMGKSRQVERTAYGLSEAKQLEIQLLSEYKENKKASIARMTVEDLYNEYKKYHENEVRATSHDKTMRTLDMYVLSSLKDIRLERLNKVKLGEWKNEVAGKDISVRTKNSIYKCFSALLNYAVKMDYIPKNLLKDLGNFRDTESFNKPEEKIQYYTPEQFIKFINVAKNEAVTVTDWGYYVFFSIAFYTGARKGEINALKWSDIDGDILHIRRSISQKVKGGDIETPPKNKSSYRDLQIPAPLMNILSEHKERQKTLSKTFSEDYRICGCEKPLRDTSIENKNTHYAKVAGLPHIRIHDFRHQYVKYTTKKFSIFSSHFLTNIC